jgi:hypothetical protein
LIKGKALSASRREWSWKNRTGGPVVHYRKSCGSTSEWGQNAKWRHSNRMSALRWSRTVVPGFRFAQPRLRIAAPDRGGSGPPLPESSDEGWECGKHFGLSCPITRARNLCRDDGNLLSLAREMMDKQMALMQKRRNLEKAR